MLRDRKVGASTFYGLNDGAMPEPARRVWELVRGQVSDAVLEADRMRAEHLRRAEQSGRSWPDSIAGEMERHYSPGRTWEATARGLLGFVALGDVLDVGAGDGAIAELLAPRARSITCVDKSERMVDAARRRLSRFEHARVVQTDMHALELEAASFDQVLVLNALSYAREPAKVMEQVARVLRPGGTVAVVTLARHTHLEVSSAYGHVHAGFEPKELERWLSLAGLDVRQCSVTSRERRKPYFEVVTAFAAKPARERYNGAKNRNDALRDPRRGEKNRNGNRHG
jgi:ArsR family transcriptional regulator